MCPSRITDTSLCLLLNCNCIPTQWIRYMTLFHLNVIPLFKQSRYLVSPQRITSAYEHGYSWLALGQDWPLHRIFLHIALYVLNSCLALKRSSICIYIDHYSLELVCLKLHLKANLFRYRKTIIFLIHITKYPECIFKFRYTSTNIFILINYSRKAL